MAPKWQKRRVKQKTKPLKMTKGPPKLSISAEEKAAYELYQNSIPESMWKQKTQTVVDAEPMVSQVESSASETDEEPTMMNQLLNEIGVDMSAESSSSEAENSGSNQGDYEDDDEYDDDEEEYDGEEYDGEEAVEEDDSIITSDDIAADSSDESGNDHLHASVGVSEKSTRGKSAESSDNNKRSLDEKSVHSSSNESSEQLSLGASSSASSHSESELKGTSKKKKLKPLDLAIDPDDIADESTVKKNNQILETIKPGDPFSKHFEFDLDEADVPQINDRKFWRKVDVQLQYVGKGTYLHPTCMEGELKMPPETSTLPALGVRSRLFNLIGKTLKNCCNSQQTSDSEPTLNSFQKEVFGLINSYKDFYYPNQKWDNLEHIRLVYSLHALNHILKTRLRVTLNSEEKWSVPLHKQDPQKEYRDQGLTRPKVLIITPFKEGARRIINIFESLLMTKKKSFVTNKKRFLEEFSPEESVGVDPKKPDDYKKMFSGNTDDCFRVGIGISKSGMKLYSDFYKSDILVCSPLGLRLILGAEGDESRDFDFMSSIEIVVMDQADVFLMQNWQHVLNFMDMLHVQPKQSHDTDFSRIRMWTLNGYAKHYRQTIFLSSVHTPEFFALFTKHCSNYAGELRVHPEETNGSICQVVTAMPLIFQKFTVSSAQAIADDRFNYFVSEILPQYRVKERAGTLIYIPSYYDYVRLRNHLKKESIDTSLICEYVTDKAIRRAKNKFCTKETHFMLYTERVHFFRRMHIKKIRHLLFYSLPTYPHFFSEMCNMYKTSQQADASCLVLFSKLEAYKLSACIGAERTRHIMNGDKSVYMFVTGESGDR